MEARFYTVTEAARILRVSKKTVYDWMNAGRLGYVQAGPRKRLIPADALDLFRRTYGVGPGKSDSSGHNGDVVSSDSIRTPSLAAA